MDKEHLKTNNGQNNLKAYMQKSGVRVRSATEKERPKKAKDLCIRITTGKGFKGFSILLMWWHVEWTKSEQTKSEQKFSLKIFDKISMHSHV